MKTVIRLLEKLAPPACVAPGDNIGLIVGDPGAKLRGVGVALDLTPLTLDLAEKAGCNLVIVHHPPIFHPLSKIDLSTPQGKLLARAITLGISVYAMHTNLDFAPRGLNDHVARQLGLREVRAVPAHGGAVYRAGALPSPLSARAFARSVKTNLRLPGVRLYGNPLKPVLRVAVCTGSGADYLAHAVSAGADALVTGDVRHHHGLECAGLDAVIVDAGHWGTERPMVDLVTGHLKKMLAKSRKGTRITPLHTDGPFVDC